MSSAPLFQLRPYQQHTISAHQAAWTGARRPTGTGPVNRTAAVLATGMGKTVIFSAQVAQTLAEGKRAVVMVHREELAEQTVAKIRAMAPGARIGVVKADRNDIDADVVIASVQTLANRKRLDALAATASTAPFGLGIVDECHHSSADTWRAAMTELGAFGPEGRAIPWAGYTATMVRGDTKALGEIWSEVVAQYGIDYGIERGFLSPVRGIRVQVQDLMLDRVRQSRGDFSDADLGSSLVAADVPHHVVNAYLEHCPGRRAILFAPTIDSAKAFEFEFNMAAAGRIPCESVFGHTSSAERAAIYDRLRTGETLVVCSVGVLTEGFDAPWVEVAIMARPTSLPGLYTQCIGRVLRPFPAGGKSEALVLDVVGVSERLSLASLVDLVGPKSTPYPDEPREPGVPTDGFPRPIEPEIARYVDGKLVATQVDLFGASPSAWLQTRGEDGEQTGIWFLPTASSYWFLWPMPDGLFRLGRYGVRAVRGYRPDLVEDGVTLEDGMAWAERYAAEEDTKAQTGRISSRSASWRAKHPTQKTLDLAARLGIPAAGDMKQGELSNQITVALASRLIPAPKRM